MDRLTPIYLVVSFVSFGQGTVASKMAEPAPPSYEFRSEVISRGPIDACKIDSVFAELAGLKPCSK